MKKLLNFEKLLFFNCPPNTAIFAQKLPPSCQLPSARGSGFESEDDVTHGQGFTDRCYGKMVNKCCVAGCENFTCLKDGVSIHRIPYHNNGNPEAKRRRKRWINFFRVRRDKWEPGNTSSICAQHFRLED